MVMRGERQYTEYADMSFPAGIPVKIQLVVANVPTSETTLAKVSLGLATPWEKFPTINQNVPIELPKPVVKKYTILEKDSYGNWTKRKDQKGNVTTRKITYYE